MFWVLVFSYWIHLLATVIWFGSLVLLALAAAPALRNGLFKNNGWLLLQQRLTPWANISLILLLITGFVQMTNDVNYSGFLVVDSTWAWAILIKHIAFAMLAGATAYLQFGLYPALERLGFLLQKRGSWLSKNKKSCPKRNEGCFG